MSYCPFHLYVGNRVPNHNEHTRIASLVSNIKLRSKLGIYLFHLVLPIARICADTERAWKAVVLEKEFFELLIKMDL